MYRLGLNMNSVWKGLHRVISGSIHIVTLRINQVTVQHSSSNPSLVPRLSVGGGKGEPGINCMHMFLISPDYGETTYRILSMHLTFNPGHCSYIQT